MITITNFASGELEIALQGEKGLRLSRDLAHRLILAARMHGPQDFIQKIPQLIGSAPLSQAITRQFEGGDPSGKWRLKEKFARLVTVTKDHKPKDLEEVIETITL
ncbi:MAG: hypothetical protein A3I75_06335 [Deltaproteobacteria bacterium RIFCSPLOWO2_02_FULL_50_16]|nr:MAG: hypothetical protein A3I75_06335 [Deltaproteobacteria bacterium RIFCSPLOWO2_02_FULL_50_16]